MTVVAKLSDLASCDASLIDHNTLDSYKRTVAREKQCSVESYFADIDTWLTDTSSAHFGVASAILQLKLVQQDGVVLEEEQYAILANLAHEVPQDMQTTARLMNPYMIYASLLEDPDLFCYLRPTGNFNSDAFDTLNLSLIHYMANALQQDTLEPLGVMFRALVGRQWDDPEEFVTEFSERLDGFADSLMFQAITQPGSPKTIFSLPGLGSHKDKKLFELSQESFLWFNWIPDIQAWREDCMESA